MHEFARKIGTANETQIEDSQQETLKKLELLLITDVSFYILYSYSVTVSPRGMSCPSLL